MESTRIQYRIDRKKLCLVKFILEGYDSLCYMSTLDPGEGMVEFVIPPDSEGLVMDILHDLSMQIHMEIQKETRFE